MSIAGLHKDSAKPAKKWAIANAHISIVPDGVPATPGELGYTECPCPKKCSLHGQCSLCTAYHGRKGALPCRER